MARVLIAHVGDLKATSNDSVANGDIYIRVTNPPSGPNPLDTIATDLAVGLKVLGLYRTPIQLNNQLVTVIKDYLNNVHSIPTNSYDAAYVSGGLGSL